MATVNLPTLTTIRQVKLYISEALGSNQFRQRTFIQSRKALLVEDLLIEILPQPLRLSVIKIAYNDDTEIDLHLLRAARKGDLLT